MGGERMMLAGQVNYSILNRSGDISGSITTNLLKEHFHELVNIQDLQESKGTLLECYFVYPTIFPLILLRTSIL
jgi:hypothetical protein